jgi:glycerol-3-phosphate dehydrogenase
MDEPAEGVHTIRVASALAERYGVGMPIVGMLHRILFDGAPAGESLQRLMRYRIRQDVDFL